MFEGNLFLTNLLTNFRIKFEVLDLRLNSLNHSEQILESVGKLYI